MSSFQNRLIYGRLGSDPMFQRKMQVADESRTGFVCLGNQSLYKLMVAHKLATFFHFLPFHLSVNVKFVPYSSPSNSRQ